MLDLLAHDSKLPPEEEVKNAVNHFVERCAQFYYSYGKGQFLLDTEELFKVIESSFRFLLHYKEFSGFKAAGIFTLLMASKKPVGTSLPDEFGAISTEPNIVLGILESLFWLHGADLMTQEGVKRIKNPIQFSDHYLIELYGAVSLACQNFQGDYDKADDRSKACLAALLFESLAYQSNNDIPYKDPAKNPLVHQAKVYFSVGKDIRVV